MFIYSALPWLQIHSSHSCPQLWHVHWHLLLLQAWQTLNLTLLVTASFSSSPSGSVPHDLTTFAGAFKLCAPRGVIFPEKLRLYTGVLSSSSTRRRAAEWTSVWNSRKWMKWHRMRPQSSLGMLMEHMGWGLPGGVRNTRSMWLPSTPPGKKMPKHFRAI